MLSIKYTKGGEAMEIANHDIREAIRSANLKYWKIASVYGITDGNFSRLLRHELSKEKKEKLFEIIEKIKREEN